MKVLLIVLIIVLLLGMTACKDKEVSHTIVDSVGGGFPTVTEIVGQGVNCDEIDCGGLENDVRSEIN